MSCNKALWNSDIALYGEILNDADRRHLDTVLLDICEAFKEPEEEQHKESYLKKKVSKKFEPIRNYFSRRASNFREKHPKATHYLATAGKLMTLLPVAGAVATAGCLGSSYDMEIKDSNIHVQETDWIRSIDITLKIKGGKSGPMHFKGNIVYTDDISKIPEEYLNNLNPTAANVLGITPMEVFTSQDISFWGVLNPNGSYSGRMELVSTFFLKNLLSSLLPGNYTLTLMENDEGLSFKPYSSKFYLPNIKPIMTDYYIDVEYGDDGENDLDAILFDVGIIDPDTGVVGLEFEFFKRSSNPYIDEKIFIHKDNLTISTPGVSELFKSAIPNKWHDTSNWENGTYYCYISSSDIFGTSNLINVFQFDKGPRS